jgi:hypothetical protein
VPTVNAGLEVPVHVTKEGVEELRKALPKCGIYWNPPTTMPEIDFDRPYLRRFTNWLADDRPLPNSHQIFPNSLLTVTERVT